MKHIRETSEAAYNALMSSGFIARKMREAYQLLYLKGPLTGDEIADYGLIDGCGSTYFKMMAPLKRMGLVQEVGEVVNPKTNFRNLVLDVTSKMPPEERYRPPRSKTEIIAELSQKTAELQKQIEERDIELNRLRALLGQTIVDAFEAPREE